MKSSMPYIAWAIMWVAVSAAVSIAIYKHGSIGSLWAFLIPGSLGIYSSKGSNNE